MQAKEYQLNVAVSDHVGGNVSAVLDSYDGAPDAVGEVALVGWGKTAKEAIADLVRQKEEIDERT